MSECLETSMARNKAGYGSKRIRGADGAWVQTTHHRVIYANHHGLTIDDLDGLVVMHTCDNPPCINIDHLVLGTHADNAADKVAKGRASGGAKMQAGGGNNNAKVSEAQVDEIRSRYAAGERQADLMREFGLTRQNVWCIVHRKSWVGFDTATPNLISDFSAGKV